MKLENVVEAVWKELQRYTVMVSKTEGNDQHLYSFTGLVDKNQLTEAIAKELKGD